MIQSDVTNNLAVFVERRSIRRYTAESVSRELVERLLTAAIWSPSAHNRQPFRICVITDATTTERLALRMGEQLRHDLESDGVSQEVITVDTGRSYARMTQSPVVIVLCLSMSEMDTYPDGRRAQNEYLMAVQSTAMAGQNVLLAAHQLGLGACWMCAPLFCPQIVVDVLALPTDWQPQGLITVGYPAETRTKTRRSLSERVLWR